MNLISSKQDSYGTIFNFKEATKESIFFLYLVGFTDIHFDGKYSKPIDNGPDYLSTCQIVTDHQPGYGNLPSVLYKV